MAKTTDTIRMDELQDSVEGQSVVLQRLSASVHEVGRRVEQVASRITSKMSQSRSPTSDKVLARAEGRSAARDEGQARAQVLDTKERILQGRDDRHGNREATLSGLMSGKLDAGGRSALRSALGTDSTQAKDLRRLGEGELKNLKQQREETQKRLLLVRDERKLNEEKLVKSRELLKTTKATDDIVKESSFRHSQEIKGKSRAVPPKGGDGDGDGDEGGRRRRGRFGVSPLEVLSDLHIPGISHLATVAKYAQMGGNAGTDAAGGKGALGVLGNLAGTAGGLVAGAGIAYGGMAGIQGYRAYRTGHEMSMPRRRLQGLLGVGGEVSSRSPVTSDALSALGYGGMENMHDLGSLSRQLGGGAALSQLGQVSGLARGYGLDRSEIGGQAEQLMMAGGTKGAHDSVDSLQRIMATGVAAGMDRARITHFTQQVVGIQDQILQATGENKTEAISESLGKLFAASGSKESFFKGPEMGAVRGIDSAMRSGSRSMSGPGTATMLRALGFGSSGDGKRTAGNEYYAAAREMEGGLFGGKGSSTGKLRKIIGQFTSESGGNEKVANLRMKQELGIGLRQMERLRVLLDKEKSVGKLSGKEDKELNKILEGPKDPIVELSEITARNEGHLMTLADEIGPEILGIDRAMSALQTELNSDVKSIVTMLRTMSESTTGKSLGENIANVGWKDLVLGVGGAVLAFKALSLAASTVAGTVAGLGTGISSVMGVLGAAGGIPGVGMAVGTAAALTDLPSSFSDNNEFKDRLGERSAGRGFFGNMLHFGDTIEAAGTMTGEGIGHMMGIDSEKDANKRKIMNNRYTSAVSQRLIDSGRGADAEKYIKAAQANPGAIPSFKDVGIAPMKSDSPAPPSVSKAEADIAAAAEMHDKRKEDAADVSDVDKKNAPIEQIRAMRLLTLAVEENTEAVGKRTSNMGAPGGRVR